MKLLNNDGRFQFIKNQQVKIDKGLPKYLAVKVLKDVKQEGSFMGYSDTINSIDRNDGNVDETLRDIIESLTNNSIIKYLKSDDAKEFNKMFAKILLGEVNINKHSLAVFGNRWVQEVGVSGDTLNVMCDDLYTVMKNNNKKTLNFFKKFKRFFQKQFSNKTQKEEMSVIDFFRIIHILGNKDKEFIDRIGGYFKLFENARKMNQTAQMDEICQKIILDIYESVLFVNGYNKYVTFGELESLNIPGTKMIDICYLEEFGRVIPDDVVEKKLECDKMHVFDNYCVMYYDPDGKTYQKTTSEAKRDPILFGLINHSDKLYYIADWIDDLCDLTLEKIAEKCNVKEIE